MFLTLGLSNQACKCGTAISFSTIRPNRTKLFDIQEAVLANGIATFFVPRTITGVEIGQEIEIVVEDLNAQGFSGKYIVREIVQGISVGNSRAVISNFSVNINRADITKIRIIAAGYSVNNIPPKSIYYVNFTTEVKVPATAVVSFSPSSYTLEGSANFVPQSVVTISSTYTTSTKTILKLSITDNHNTVLYTEYLSVVCSEAGASTCERIYEKPVTDPYIYLNPGNNWSFFYNNYPIIRFIPNKSYGTVSSIRLDKKQSGFLPTSFTKNRFRIIVDPIKLVENKVTMQQLRTALDKQLDTVVSTTAGSLAYDILLKETPLLSEQVGKVLIAMVDQVQPVSGPGKEALAVYIKQVADIEDYPADNYALPTVGLLRAGSSFIGELVYIENIYGTDIIRITHNGIDLCGKILPAQDSIISLSQCP